VVSVQISSSVSLNPAGTGTGTPGVARYAEEPSSIGEILIGPDQKPLLAGSRWNGIPIQMPPFESFRDAESYAATLAHECVHWTAPAHRANRDLSRYAQDRSERAREELVAELGACFLCADLGIVPELEPRADHASYLASWLDVLSNDKRFIFSAAAHAQRAVTYLHELQPKPAEIGEAG